MNNAGNKRKAKRVQLAKETKKANRDLNQRQLLHQLKEHQDAEALKAAKVQAHAVADATAYDQDLARTEAAKAKAERKAAALVAETNRKATAEAERVAAALEAETNRKATVEAERAAAALVAETNRKETAEAERIAAALVAETARADAATETAAALASTAAAANAAAAEANNAPPPDPAAAAAAEQAQENDEAFTDLALAAGFQETVAAFGTNEVILDTAAQVTNLYTAFAAATQTVEDASAASVRTVEHDPSDHFLWLQK